MSIVNFQLQRDRVVVAVDTIGGVRGQQLHVNKMFPIAHARMIVCGRGSMGFLWKVVNLCSMLSGVDEAQQLLPRVMTWLLWMTRLQALLLGKFRSPAVFGKQEIYVFGWSEHRGEMVALEFTQSKTSGKFHMVDDLGELIAPNLDGFFPSLDSVEVMRSVASKQVQKAMQEDPSMPIGGRLMIGELTPEKCTVYCAGEIQINHLYKYRSKTSAAETPTMPGQHGPQIT